MPRGLDGVVAIAAGAWHSLALRTDGTVVAWGHPDSDQRQVPHGLAGVVAIAAGYENSSAILPDGSVIDWGNDTYFWDVPSTFHDVAAIAYGWRHRLALRRDGSVVSDGREMGGVQIPADLTDVTAIAGAVTADHRSFIALKKDGTLRAIKHSVVGYQDPAAPPGFSPPRYPALEIPSQLIGLERS